MAKAKPEPARPRRHKGIENWSVQELVEYCAGQQLHAMLHGERLYDAMYRNVLVVLNWKERQR